MRIVETCHSLALFDFSSSFLPATPLAFSGLSHVVLSALN